MAMRYWDKEAGEDPRQLAAEDVEVWAFCPGTNERYSVSNLGRVYSHVTDSLLQPFNNGNGYLAVSISPEKYAGKTKLVHRVAVEAFDGPPPSEEHTDVRHTPDATKTNNKLGNLCWGTRSENMMDVLLARQEGKEPTQVEKEGGKWYQGYTDDDYLVSVGLRWYEEGLLQQKHLQELWRCSRDVVANIVKGRTRMHVERPSALAARNDREGDKHHKATVSDDDLAEAFRLYTEEQWSGVKFAEFLGIKQVTAHSILSGKTRKGVPRPKGFQYPWPGAASRWSRTGSSHHSAKLNEEKVTELVARVAAGEFKTIKEFIEVSGLKSSPARAILKNTSWKKVPRPDGFSEAVAKMKAEGNRQRGQTVV